VYEHEADCAEKDNGIGIGTTMSYGVVVRFSVSRVLSLRSADSSRSAGLRDSRGVLVHWHTSPLFAALVLRRMQMLDAA